MSQRVDDERACKISRGSSTNGARAVGSASPQEDIHRSGEKNNELLHLIADWLGHVHVHARDRTQSGCCT